MATRPDRESHDELADAAREASDLGRYAGLGFQFVATLGLFGLAGWWLDRKLGWSPWLLVTGIFLGGALAFAQIVLSVNRASAARSSPSSTRSTTPHEGAGGRASDGTDAGASGTRERRR